MKKQITALCTIFILMISVGFVVAGKNQQQKQDKEFSLPENAKEVAPGVFYLGKSFDKGKFVEGYAFLMKEGEAKKARPSKDSSCYTLLAREAKWKTVEDYIFDPMNNEGLGEIFLRSTFFSSVNKWEIAAGTTSILGYETSGTVDGADFQATDGKNEIMFEDLGETNTIAFTIVWGLFGGPPFARELVEWDMVFNDNYVWADAMYSTSGVMDFENIATHELGHAVGLGDLYNKKCAEQTMFGYATESEIKKRTLESGDITGIQTLY